MSRVPIPLYKSLQGLLTTTRKANSNGCQQALCILMLLWQECRITAVRKMDLLKEKNKILAILNFILGFKWNLPEISLAPVLKE